MKNILDTFRQGHHEFENSRLDGFEGVNPYELFELWTTEAVENKENEPNAFVLATVSSNGQSSSRIVYLKDIIEERFVFYTNYSSQKGVDIESNPKVSMLFFGPMQRVKCA
jgi:pyridoxamine 5'-phosphate oxidase